jgi:ABC-type amino acid transport substrate-binding protein
MSVDPKNSNLRSKGRGTLTPYSANLRAKKALFAISYRSDLEVEIYNGYGSLWSNGTWTGMIASLINGDTEVAVGDFTMSTQRAEVVDFTVPICETT